MEKVREYLLSAVLGLITGMVGAYLMGYLAAIVIPESVFQWLEENQSVLVGMVALDIIFQFFAFGVLGILSALLIARFQKNDWRINTLAYYAFYMTVVVAVIYSVQIQPIVSLPYIKQTLGLPILVLPLCLVITGYFANRRV